LVDYVRNDINDQRTNAHREIPTVGEEIANIRRCVGKTDIYDPATLSHLRRMVEEEKRMRNKQNSETTS